MSLTRKDADKFCRNYQCFSKLLILYPMIHPATIHGLLVEFNYDYGFVMQLILKLESQRNTLYWEEVARASQVMEQQNRAKMTLCSDANNTNRRLTQMMDVQMSESINSLDGPSTSNLQSATIMEIPTQQSTPTTFAEIMQSQKNQTNNFPAEANNINSQLNQVLQGSEIRPTQQYPDLNSFDPRFAGMVGNPNQTNYLAPVSNNNWQTNETLNSVKPHTSQTYLDPNIASCSTTPNNTNWQINETGELPKERTIQIDSRYAGIDDNQNGQSFYLNLTHTENNLRIYELVEATKSQFHTYSNVNSRNPGIAEPQRSQTQYSYSVPMTRNLQTTFEQVPNLQTSQSQLYSNNFNYHQTENQLKNPMNQTNYINPALDNSNLQINEIRNIPNLERVQPQQYNNTYMNAIRTIDHQRNYIDPLHYKTNLQINDYPNLETTQSQNENYSGYINRMNYTSLVANNSVDQMNEIVNVPGIQTTNPNSMQNAELLVDPLNQSQSELDTTSQESENTDDQIMKTSPKKIPANKRIRKPKLPFQVNKILETQMRRAVKRRMKIATNAPMKKIRKENQIIKTSSNLQGNELNESNNRGNDKLRSNTNKTKENKSEQQQIEPDIKLNNKKGNPKRKIIKSRPNPKKTTGKGKENKKRATSKTQQNKTKLKTNKNTVGEDFILSSFGTDLISIDPTIIKIEHTSEGDLITVCPTLHDDVSGKQTIFNTVQFIRKFPVTSQSKKQYPPILATGSTSEDDTTTTTESEMSDSQIPKNTGKQPVRKNTPRANRQEAGTVTKSQATTKIEEKKTTKRRVTPNKKGDDEKKEPDPPKPPPKKNNGRKTRRGSISCCCQSIGFRKKYKLPPFDQDDMDDLYPDELLFPEDSPKPKGNDPYDPSRESLFEYYKRNPNADRDMKKYYQVKKKVAAPKKTVVKRLYNTRSSKERKQKSKK